MIIFQTQCPPASIIGNIKDTEFYEDVKYCPDAIEIENTKIIRYEANIYYANVENFTYQITKLSTVNPREIIELLEKKKEESEKRLKKIKSKKIKEAKKTAASNEAVAGSSKTDLETDEQEQEKKNLEAEIDSILNKIKIKNLILDLSSINYIDSMGAESIIRVIQIELKKLNPNLIKMFT